MSQPARLSREDEQLLAAAVRNFGPEERRFAMATRLRAEGIRTLEEAYSTPENRRTLVRVARDVGGKTGAWRQLAAVVRQLHPRPVQAAATRASISAAVSTAKGRVRVSVPTAERGAQTRTVERPLAPAAEPEAETTAVVWPVERPERRARRLVVVQARADRLQEQVARLTHEKDDLAQELAAARVEIAALKALLGEAEQGRAEVAERRREAEQEAERIIERARREAADMIVLARIEAEAIRDAAASRLELPAPPEFSVEPTGFQPTAVDKFIERIRSHRVWHEPPAFPQVGSGYDRRQVVVYLDKLRRAVGG